MIATAGAQPAPNATGYNRPTDWHEHDPVMVELLRRHGRQHRLLPRDAALTR
jgi:purine nucleoside phosphorylase